MKILLALSDKISNVAKLLHNNAVNYDFQIEEVDDVADLERYIVSFNPEVIVMSEYFGADSGQKPLDIVKFVRSKTNARIVYFSLPRIPGDPFLAALVNLGIYNIFHKSELSSKEIIDSVLTPATWGDVAHLVDDSVFSGNFEPPKEIVKEVVKEVPKEVIKEVVKEVPKEIVKEVVKEVPVVKEVIKEVPKIVIKEVPKEIIKEKEVIKEVKIYEKPEGFKKSVCFYSPVSAGKTFISYNVAKYLAKDHKVALADFDLHNHSLFYYFNMDNYSYPNSIIQTIQHPNEDISYKEGNLSVYTCFKEIKKFDLMMEEVLTFHNSVKSRNDVIIYDTGNNTTLRHILNIVDEIYLVTTMEYRTIDKLAESIKELYASMALNKLSLIINQYVDIKGVSVQDVVDYFKELETEERKINISFNKVIAVPSCPELAYRCEYENQPAFSFKGGEEVEKAIAQIADAIYSVKKEKTKRGFSLFRRG
ncbi:hypothetical protein [Caldanaerobacter subterraneus]|uniref:CobQ/CobB/MinD/ParA nucleotide binding domain-containing protein n=1 Tax=Caldanaerobacter subterraneus TaxID=911092 RepID=A0A7Y2PNA7_9THEO|nr:hypothetical protein [Caldanaerobacter subterraneus]NNG67556.1 hypothetical protein [Caldanaerobacter subterraneus]